MDARGTMPAAGETRFRRTMEAKLKVTNGAHAGRELPLKGPKFFIGRAEDCQLRPKSDLISRHHCVLLIDDDCLAIRDLGSRNGTLVNDEKVRGEQELSAGDALKVGPLEFEVVIKVGEKAKKRPQVTSIKEAVARAAENAQQEAEQDDLDVSNFFVEDEATQSDRATTDTLVGPLTDTDSVPLGETQAGPSSEEEETETAPMPEEPKPEPKKEPARPPRKVPASNSEDSGSAAAEALRRFMNRR